MSRSRVSSKPVNQKSNYPKRDENHRNFRSAFFISQKNYKENKTMNEEKSSPKVLIYADGSCLRNGSESAQAGAGVVLMTEDRRRIKLKASYLGALTNQKAEILACAIGLESLKKPSRVRIFSDSKYVVETMLGRNRMKTNREFWSRQKKTDWFNVSAFGKQAETLAKYLTKGSQILVRGKLSFNPWLSRDGEARVSADVVLQDFEFAGANPARVNVEAAAREAESKQEASREMVLPDASEDTEERAEMMAVLEEISASDEPFAGQF
jgi:single stranded DNA-binding protein